MTVDQKIATFKVLVELLGLLLWPVLVALLALTFRVPLRRFFENVGELSVKGPGGLEATAKLRQIEAAALLGAAEATKAETPAEGPPSPPEEKARNIAAAVSSAARRQAAERLAEASVLWVDDKPANNTAERRALETTGIRITLSTSTQDALARLQHRHFDVIISDMERSGDPRAGFTLLDQVQRVDSTVPFIIYAGSVAVNMRDEFLKRGAYGSTNRPQELFQLVTQALQERDRRGAPRTA